MSRVASPAEEVVEACRVLVHLGVLDVSGHVSVCDPQDPSRFWLPRNLAPTQVRLADVLQHDLDGAAAQEVPLIGERFIHAAVYRARPEVGAVVHTHSTGAVTVSIGTRPLVPVLHLAGFLGAGAPVLDLSAELGAPSDLMVDDTVRGQALVRVLGDAAYLLMRGHGAVAVGTSVAEAVYRAHVGETNARILLQAAALGPVQHLSAPEADAASRTDARQAARAWPAWLELAGATRLAGPGEAD